MMIQHLPCSGGLGNRSIAVFAMCVDGAVVAAKSICSFKASVLCQVPAVLQWLRRPLLSRSILWMCFCDLGVQLQHLHITLQALSLIWSGKGTRIEGEAKQLCQDHRGHGLSALEILAWAAVQPWASKLNGHAACLSPEASLRTAKKVSRYKTSQNISEPIAFFEGQVSPVSWDTGQEITWQPHRVLTSRQNTSCEVWNVKCQYMPMYMTYIDNIYI